MKFKKYKKMAYAALLASAGAVHAETGNSVVFNDPENNLTIALDRIHIATLPAHERSALLGAAEDQLGEGRVMEKPESCGSFIVDRQQDSSGSLSGKTFDVEFAPLATGPEISKATPTRLRQESEGMEKTADAGGVYYVAAPGVWGQSYGGQAWWTPTNEYFKATGWRPATDPQKIACTGTTKYEYNKTSGYKAFWERGPKWNYNVAVGIERDLGEIALSPAVKVKLTYKETLSTGTQLIDYTLWSNTYWDYEDGNEGTGTLLYTYNEVTTNVSKFIGYQTKITFSPDAWKPDNASANVSASVVAQVNFGNTTSSQTGLRQRNVQDVGYSEASDAFTLTGEFGVQVKVAIGPAEATGTVYLGYKFTQGSASGTRDFDTFCYAHDPQRYIHNGYRTHEVYTRAEAKVKVGVVTVSVGTKATLFSSVNPGRFVSTNARELRGTSLDYKM